MAGNIPKDFIRMIFWYCFLCSFWWLKENGPFCTGLVIGIVSGIGCSETYIMAQSLKCSFSRVKLTFLCDTVTHRSFPALCAENPCLGSCLSWLLLSHKTIFFFLLNLNFLPMNGLNLDAGRSSKRKVLADGDGSRGPEEDCASCWHL